MDLESQFKKENTDPMSSEQYSSQAPLKQIMEEEEEEKEFVP